MPQPSSSDPFGSTRWSVVLAAGGEGPGAQEALEALCSTYWLPVYGYARSRTRNVDDAYDRTQGFFADLLARRAIAAADPARGRFRAFLLTALQHYLANEHARAVALKRGGGRRIEPLDRCDAEARLAGARSAAPSPEREFERRWALALLHRVLERLAAEQSAAGRDEEFAALRPFLTGQQEHATQVELAGRLGVAPEAVRAALYRLRKRYRSLLRDEVAQTVSSPDEVDDELHDLIAALSG